ncbi:hypothetical protein ACXC9Q_12585 [Kribbella sp. CWNU-51]
MNGRGQRTAIVVCLGGAVLQVGYGVAAIVVGYPRITDAGFELVWLAVNLGMIGGVIGWLQLDVARPRRLARVAGAAAIAGYLLRVAVSIWLITDPSAPADAAIVASILLMFAGLATVGVCTVRTRQLRGWAAWAPLVTVAAGLFTASWYSIDKPTHFILLGLLWGASWLALGLTLARLHARTITPTSPPTTPARQPS